MQEQRRNHRSGRKLLPTLGLSLRVSPNPIGGKSNCTATACSDRCSKPRTWCRRPICAPGALHDGFAGGSVSRLRLYRIFHQCLSGRAGEPQGRAASGPDREIPAATAVGMPQDAPPPDIAWLEPYPDFELEGHCRRCTQSGGTLTTAHEAVQLAFLAAIQHLPPRQPCRPIDVRCARLGGRRSRGIAWRLDRLGQQRATAGARDACQTLSARTSFPVAPRQNPDEQELPRPAIRGLGKRTIYGQLHGSAQEGRDLHHAAVGAMVCGARGHRLVR